MIPGGPEREAPLAARTFMQAQNFMMAAEALEGRLHQPRGDPRLQRLQLPWIVLSAFSTELYFKTLLVLEGGAAKLGHDLGELFEQLPPRHQEGVEASWNARISRMKGLPENTDTVLRSVLKDQGDWFVRLRYFHESGELYRPGVDANGNQALICYLPPAVEDYVLHAKLFG